MTLNPFFLQKDIACTLNQRLAANEGLTRRNNINNIDLLNNACPIYENN
jgi:hypothetical protein